MGWDLLAIAGAVVLVDQTAKALAIRFLSPAGPAAAGAVGLTLAANRGWWLGGSPTAPVLIALWGLTLGCTALALAAGPDLASNQLASAGLVVALAGAASNLWDRVRRGAVVDFIVLGRWPTFNLADVAIVAGVAVALGAVA
jgi:signal peptidase II